MATALFRASAKLATRSSALSVAARSVAVRAMTVKASNGENKIGDIENLAGRARNEAVFRRAFGEDLFDRDATAYFEEGTRENPIPIYSVEDSRVVGVSLPDDAEVRWFTLKAGELAYDPDTCNFFALKKVTQAEVDEWIAKAENKVFGSQ